MLRELRFARTMSARPWGTFGLLALLVLVFVVTTAIADLLTGRFRESVPYEVIVLFGAKNNAAIRAGQYWRLGTSILLHGGLFHLLVNAYALYVLGTVLERLYGLRRFLILFFVSGFGGAIASYLFTSANSVGASGAIFGLLGAAVIFGLKFHGILPGRIRRLLTVGLLPWVALNLFIGTAFPQIDNGAHIGGMVTGCIVALFLGSRLQARPGAVRIALQWVVLTASIGIMTYSVVGAFVDNASCASSVATVERCLDVLTAGN